MSINPVLPLIPDLASFFSPDDANTVQNLKCAATNGNQLYSLGYATFQVGKYLTETVLDDVFGVTGFTGFTGTTGAASISDAIAGAEFWFGRLAIFLVLPWLLIFIALFIYLGITGVMSGFAAIIFIVMTLILAGFTLFFVIWDARYTVLRIRNDVGFAVTTTVNDISSTLDEQIDLNGDYFGSYLVSAYTLTGSVNANEDQVCCGFDPISSGCQVSLCACPEVIPTGATGTLTLYLTGPVGYTGGFLVIPPELNGGTGTTIPLPSEFGTPFTYSTTSQPGSVQIQTVFIGGGTLPTFEVLSNTIFILNPSDITSATGTTFSCCNNVIPNVSDINSDLDGTMTEDTRSSMAQLQQTLQQAQLLQEGLQQRLGRHKRVDEPVQRIVEPIRGGCRSCFKKPIRTKRAPVCPNGNCQ